MSKSKDLIFIYIISECEVILLDLLASEKAGLKKTERLELSVE